MSSKYVKNDQIDINKWIANNKNMPREGSLGPDAREQVEHEKVSPLSEKGANCDESYDQQNDEVNKQLLKFMTDLEVDVTNKSIGKD